MNDLRESVSGTDTRGKNMAYFNATEENEDEKKNELLNIGGFIFKVDNNPFEEINTVHEYEYNHIKSFNHEVYLKNAGRVPGKLSFSGAFDTRKAGINVLDPVRDLMGESLLVVDGGGWNRGFWKVKSIQEKGKYLKNGFPIMVEYNIEMTEDLSEDLNEI